MVHLSEHYGTAVGAKYLNCGSVAVETCHEFFFSIFVFMGSDPRFLFSISVNDSGNWLGTGSAPSPSTRFCDPNQNKQLSFSGVKNSRFLSSISDIDSGSVLGTGSAPGTSTQNCAGLVLHPVLAPGSGRESVLLQQKKIRTCLFSLEHS